jgi:CheY-like chemotaxis protein
MTGTSTTTSLRPVIAVDADVEDAEVFSLLLRKAGIAHPVQFFKRGEELAAALTSLLKKSAAVLPLVCFLELALPDMQGLELLGWIRSHPAFDAISVVMLSASENPDHVKRAAYSGAQCYLAKYPQPSALARVVSEATELAAHRPARHWFGLRENLILRWGPSSAATPPA